MQSTEIQGLLKDLKLFGMLNSYQETEMEAIRNKHTFIGFLNALCCTEKEERKVRSIRYQMGIAKFPASKGIDTFVFDDTPYQRATGTQLVSRIFPPATSQYCAGWRHG